LLSNSDLSVREAAAKILDATTLAEIIEGGSGVPRKERKRREEQVGRHPANLTIERTRDSAARPGDERCDPSTAAV